MAIIYCEKCNKLVDDDWHPFEDVDGELICPICIDQMIMNGEAYHDESGTIHKTVEK